MSQIEKARRELKLSGYIHPTNTNSNERSSRTGGSLQTNKYKSFNENSKDYKSNQKLNNYATFTNKETYMTCPKCNFQALYECNCKLKDKQCANGHIWFINEKGKIQLGDPHGNE